MRRHRTVDPSERSRILERLAADLAADPDVAFAYVYGSFVGSEPFHDVDIGVYLRTTPPESMTLHSLALAEHLSTGVGLPVDVRILNAAPVSFVYHVLRGQLILNRDDDLLGEVMQRTVSRYLDIAPLLRRSTKEAFVA